MDALNYDVEVFGSVITIPAKNSTHTVLKSLLLPCIALLPVLVTAGPPPSAPPEPRREFRGVWITTIHNVDWPTREGLPMEEQQQQLVKMLDRCAEIGLNAVILQVRSECDALYPSKSEPWSPWLTGTMGASPGYDPLQFAIDAAHQRGLELHAWFNPFRAINSDHGRICKSHVSRTHPEYTVRYGPKVWLDPAIPEVRTRALESVREVLRRYDIDAVHLDDYFYPYPIKVGGAYQDFNDEKSWTAYSRSGGDLSRADWRRSHVNAFVSQVHRLVRKESPSCEFGISPFGIYRPGQPAQVKSSLDSYDQLYADTRLWLREGWLDYIAPQLYWETSSKQYGFAGLYQWWNQENVQQRHVWPGIAVYRIKAEGRTAYDALKQVNLSKTGHVLFSMESLMANYSSVTNLLKTKAYKEVALPPASPWLGNDAGKLPHASPQVTKREKDAIEVTWENSRSTQDKVRWWLLQTLSGSTWKTLRPIPGDSASYRIPGTPDQLAIRAVGHTGMLGAVHTIALSAAPASGSKP
jgi:uncharacterized lipoprotein YddW (UPF0748 family)